MKFTFFLLLSISIMNRSMAQEPIYQSPSFRIFSDRVVQGEHIAKALSPGHLVSNYQSPANLYQSAAITFKFAINGKDNEMLPGQDHQFLVNATNGEAETPIIKFGSQLKQANSSDKFLEPNTGLKIRLDMREVLKEFAEKGFYTTFRGEKIFKEDFKGVFIAGATAPMTWDFDNLLQHKDLELKDEDGDGIYELQLILNRQSDKKQTDAEWKLSADLSAYPQYQTDFLLSRAIYNLSMEEMLKAIEPDSTFRTGKEWGGVWTRDISYSIILSMAYLQPRVAMKSLMRKVSKNKKIIQDTGTGGAWPVSTDRMVWATAAWEVYLATGDKDWLREAFTIIKNSIDDDMQNVYDPLTGMVKGESSFLDWREQTYPKWMQPADIFESECLGTNAVHYQANVVLAKMANILGREQLAVKHRQIASGIKAGINRYLWIPSKGYYGQFLYGQNFKMLSQRSEALGEALCVLFGIAEGDRARKIISQTPVTEFGIPCIYPEIPNIPPYHNNAIWPFVQSYWAWAGAKAKNEKSVMESMAAIYRPAAFFLTNKENMVAETGDFNGTQVNSSIMLWSLAGNISFIHKVLFGIRFEENKLSFSPFVPKALDGQRRLNNFHYRQAILDIELKGYGDKISSFFLDGKKLLYASIPADLKKGRHALTIILNNTISSKDTTAMKAVLFSLATPLPELKGKVMHWAAIPKTNYYKVMLNGRVNKITRRNFTTIRTGVYGEYQVIAVGDRKMESFASEPLIIEGKYSKTYQAEDVAQASPENYKGFNGSGFVEISATKNREIIFQVNISKEGLYAINFRYANGNGPTNTENKCALRSLSVDGKSINTVVFPQRGIKEWSNWGNSNSLQVRMSKGRHQVKLSFEPHNQNMNEEVNQAMIDQMKIVLIK